MLNNEKPTLVLSDHPPLQRMLPVLWQFLKSNDRDGVIVADHALSIITNLLNIDLIPVFRNLDNYKAQTRSEEIKQRIMTTLGVINKSKPKYSHQGKAITNQVVTALDSKDVFLAPSGGANKKAVWRPGISHIVDSANQAEKDFSLSFVYIPDSFKERHSFVLFQSWNELLNKANLTWTDDHRQNAQALQSFYESLRNSE
jgi:hypothetical protein